MLEFDKKYFSKHKLIAGVDEAGRGPLAGPVVAATVIFKNNTYIEGVNDSKKISEKKRELLYNEILAKALHVGIGVIHADEIDSINILEATKRAMYSSLQKNGAKPDLVLIDGNQIDFKDYNSISVVKGDTKSFSIASASIIAKVTRDRIMGSYDKIAPEYDFNNNKGYGTKKHFKAISEFKSSIMHRQSFKPISNHIPSFRYYTENGSLNRLLVQISGNYLIKKNHEILDVNGLHVLSKFENNEYLSIISSNIKPAKCPSLLDKNLINQMIRIEFRKGIFNIIVEYI